MLTIKDILGLLAVVAAYGLTAYWDASDEQQAAHASAALPPAGQTASDESRSSGHTSMQSGDQHAQR